MMTDVNIKSSCCPDDKDEIYLPAVSQIWQFFDQKWTGFKILKNILPY